MMVPLAYAGQGLGAELLDWAVSRVYTAELLWLRLDAWTTNTNLHHWYEQQGSPTSAPSPAESQAHASNDQHSPTPAGD
jgi:hypothetical protein